MKNKNSKTRNGAKNLLLVFFLCFATTTAMFAQSVNAEEFWPNNDAKQNSHTFKALAGSNRTAAFSKLEELIRVVELADDQVNGSNAVGTHVTTREEILYMLGEPDKKIVMSLYEYNLQSTSSACKVVFGFDADGKLNFYSIKDCN